MRKLLDNVYSSGALAASSTALLGWVWYVWQGGLQSGIYTILLSALAYLLYLALRSSGWRRLLLVYLVFFSTPLLTITGQINVLTGFGGGGNAVPWLGVSFVTASMAYAMKTSNLNPMMLLLSALHPARWNSGPCAVHGVAAPKFRNSWRSRVRVDSGVRWIVLGAFFYSVLSSALHPLLILKNSEVAADIFIFALVFEAYVYFNFSGISFIVFGFLRMSGVPSGFNFNTPFAARDVIGFWQRWHMSLSMILKELFFRPLKSRLGVSMTVIVVFLASAAWHGISINFFVWGAFHGFCWCLSYRIGQGALWQKCFQITLLIFAIVIGRLIFSEIDTALLWTKLCSLASVGSWQQVSLLRSIHMDGSILWILIFVIVWLIGEFSKWRLALRYRLLRRSSATVVMFMCIVMWGSFGSGGVYGTR